jgi:RNA polymerase sigma factor (sigma-70 family)
MRTDKAADNPGMGSRAGKLLLKTQSDGRLVELVRAGHEGAFEEIVARYRVPLLRHLCRTLSTTAADDAVQQAFVNAWSALRGGTEVRQLGPWLYAIARNAMLRVVAAEGRPHDELPETLAGTLSTAGEAEHRSEVRAAFAALGELPARQREALIASAVHGHTREEIAHALGLSEGAVRQLVHRGRAALRAAATAVIPLPLLVRLTGDRSLLRALADRGAEVGAGAAAGGAAAKWAAVVAVTGTLVGGAVAQPSHAPSDGRAAVGQDTAASAQARPRVVAAAPLFASAAWRPAKSAGRRAAPAHSGGEQAVAEQPAEWEQPLVVDPADEEWTPSDGYEEPVDEVVSEPPAEEPPPEDLSGTEADSSADTEAGASP